MWKRSFLAVLWWVPLLSPGADPEPEGEAPEEVAAGSEVSAMVAGESAFWQALRLLEGGLEADWTEGRELLEEAARLEFTHAQNLLGGCLQSGDYGFSQSDRKAAGLFRLAAERGNAFAQVNLGRAYLLGKGVWKSKRKAREWLEAAVAEDADYSMPAPPDWFWEAMPDHSFGEGEIGVGDTPPPQVASWILAHYLLGHLAIGDDDLERAQEHFLKAAEAGERGRYGLAGAALSAALNYAFGQGTDQDLEAAGDMLERYRRLAHQSTAVFVHSLSNHSLFDRFLRAEVARELEDALEEQQVELQYQIARLLNNEDSDHFDPREAARWYELAAENGDRAWAMLSLGFLHFSGELGEPDLAAAAEWFRRAGEDGGHLLGTTNYWICLHHGWGVEADPAAAAAIYEKHAGEEIAAHLATRGIIPDDIYTYEEKFELVRHWAKREKDPHARYLYGRHYRFGWGVYWDRDTANRWFRRAAREGHAGAEYELGYAREHGLGLDRDLAKAEEHYRAAFCAGNPDAAAALGFLALQRGRVQPLRFHPAGPQSEDRYLQAAFFYEEAIRLFSEPKAHLFNNLANAFEKRLDAEADRLSESERESLRRRMVDRYRQAAEAGSAYGHFNLAELARAGIHVPQDDREAFRSFLSAADGGHPNADFYLGEMLVAGLGVTANEEEAMHHFRLVALNEDAEREHRYEALQHLSEYYLTHIDADSNFEAAEFWLSRFALMGSPAALNAFGDILISTGRHKEARQFFRKLRSSDHAYIAGHANFRLYEIYSRGDGVRVNESRADRYFADALEAENAYALEVMGERCHAAGDLQGARDWWARATEEGSGKAAYKLGRLYFFGQGVAQDLPQAYAYFRLSARVEFLAAAYNLAAAAYQELPEAPSLEEGLDYAAQAERLGHPDASTLRRMIQRKLDERAPAEKTEVGTGARGTA